MQSLSTLALNSACYSSYKGTSTMKGIVGISPLGVKSFMSKLYTGSISDKDSQRPVDCTNYFPMEML